LTVITHGFCVLVDLAATLRDLAFDDLHAVLIHAVEQVRQVLDNGEFRAEGLVNHAEFEADDAAADDEQTLRNFAQTDGFFGPDDLLAVELERRDLDGGRTRCEHDVLGFDLFDRAVGLGHIDAVFPDEHCVSGDQIRPVRLEQSAHAARELLDDAFFPVLHRVRVVLDFANLDAHGRERVVRFFVGMRRVDQGFGGNAAPVEAHAADVFLLDANGLYAELSEPDRTDIAARATTNDDCVVRFHRSSIEEGKSGPRLDLWPSNARGLP